MARTIGSLRSPFTTIYDAMYEAGLVDERIFSLCLGKNGGYVQIGGYDGTGHLVREVNWSPLL
jgi:hypothetical protein